MEHAHLHQSSIASTSSSIGERIRLAEVGAGASLLVINTEDHETFVGDRINKVLAFDNDRVRRGDRSRESAKSDDVVGELRYDVSCVVYTACIGYAQLTDFILSRRDRACCVITNVGCRVSRILSYLSLANDFAKEALSQ